MTKFTLFFQSGGGDSIRVVDHYWQKLTKICDQLSQHHYSEDINQFHITLRGDGEFLSFGDPIGCNSLRVFKKKRLIANSISFDQTIYSDENQLSQFLQDNFLLCFELMIKRIEKDKLHIQGQHLLADLKQYFNESWC